MGTVPQPVSYTHLDVYKRQEYDRALRKSPDNPALLLNVGLAYYKTGRLAEAAARFEQAVSLAPQFKEQVLSLIHI